MVDPRSDPARRSRRDAPRAGAALYAELYGRNDFEGHRTQRVYSLVAQAPIFAALVEHPRVLALCDAVLEPNYLLTASQAIRISPGETPQPFHTDDSFYRIARPRDAVSLSFIFAVDAFTAENGATQWCPEATAGRMPRSSACSPRSTSRRYPRATGSRG